jgi:hypothetical protein
MLRNYGEQDRQLETDARIERYASNVMNGAWQLTPEKTVQLVRLSGEVTRADKRFIASFANALKWHSLIEFAGLVMMVRAMFVLRRKFKEQSAVEPPTAGLAAESEVKCAESPRH